MVQLVLLGVSFAVGVKYSEPVKKAVGPTVVNIKQTIRNFVKNNVK